MPGENAAAFGLTPLEDQQIAGLLMWVPANLVFFAIATFLFARWISAEAAPPNPPAAAGAAHATLGRADRRRAVAPGIADIAGDIGDHRRHPVWRKPAWA